MSEKLEGAPILDESLPEHQPGGEHRMRFLFRKHIAAHIAGDTLVTLRSGQTVPIEDSLDIITNDPEGKAALESLDENDPAYAVAVEDIIFIMSDVIRHATPSQGSTT